VDYGYDVHDLRVSKTVNTNAAGDPERYEFYVWDGDDIVLDFADADGGASPAATFDRRYLWGQAVDQILAQETSAGVTAWHLADNLGSVRDLMDNTSELVSGSHVSYDAFGKTLSGTPATRFAFTAQEWDADAGLYYYNARWYDPRTGKFLSEDPIEFEAGDTNLLRMVGNSVTNYTDPTGNWRRPNKSTDGDLWIAEDGDTFAELVKKVTPPNGRTLNPDIDQFAIRPVPPTDSNIIVLGLDTNITFWVNEGQMRKYWKRGVPLECAYYDTSYLTTEHAPGPNVSLTIGRLERRTPDDPDPSKDNGYLATATAFFNSTPVPNGDGVREELSKASEWGKNPLPFVLLVGHGQRGGDVVGAQNAAGGDFSVEDLKVQTIRGFKFYDFLEWEFAIKGMLSTVFWFDREASVYYVGCNTCFTADDFAKILRTTAAAFGTSEFTWAVDQNTMGWSDTGDKHDPKMGTAATPEEFLKMKYWTKRDGILP